MLVSVRRWYAEHQEKTPLERANHKPQVPLSLQDQVFKDWRRGSLHFSCRPYHQAIPSTQQDDVLASKEVNTVGILSRLMLCYQPGGLSEKGAILSALDSPEEAQTLAGAVTGLRRWLRWHRRAGEVGVTRPDATLQIKGLSRLMKRVLKDSADLAFRVQLSRSSLQVDTAPTEGSVMTFANHLLAEVEQIAHQDKRRKEDARSSTEPKVKRLEESAGSSKGEGKAWKGSSGQSSTPCKFFQSEEGCKKGKQCTWSHVLEGDKTRCWTCGSTGHLAPACDKPKEPLKDSGDSSQKTGKGKGTQRPSGKALKKGEEQHKQEGTSAETVGGDGRRLVEIDVKRDDQEKHKKGAHDMLDDENGPYASLLRGTLDGSLLGIVMGPNCRTRSVLWRSQEEVLVLWGVGISLGGIQVTPQKSSERWKKIRRWCAALERIDVVHHKREG